MRLFVYRKSHYMDQMQDYPLKWGVPTLLVEVANPVICQKILKNRMKFWSGMRSVGGVEVVLYISTY